MADGFLGRWSQRKQALREGRVLDEPAAPKRVAPADAAMPPGPANALPQAVKPSANPAGQKAASASEHTPAEAAPAAPEKKPAPTLADVQALNADSSFAPFAARDVAPEVRNAAMKKLFADPHYNVMDGLDIYIDDYSIPSPMPAAMLRQMASAKFLKLFDDEESPATSSATTGTKPSVLADSPGRSASETATAPNQATAQDAAQDKTQDKTQELPQNPTQDQDSNHDHTDLRLQPDHAARPARVEREPERAFDPAFEPVPPPGR
ncbi:DUF3306 domain-containing protein [Rhodoferax sp.]|uniref:DUF3306 domain-containing protein n=1 Tax=Rhodoferax sp. TaxID=50421 RepID=UPI0019FB55C7|nr:DUF3306 domain-containing protein [Rhodoferax sp.]MBE0473546.1 DUF3306 domain-containing protein [Rhodoferax sp.]